MQRRFLVIGFLAMLAGTLCFAAILLRPPSDETNASSLAERPNQAAHDAPTPSPLPRIPTTDQSQLADLSLPNEAWSSERFSTLASEQLQQLALAARQLQRMDASAISRLTSSDFRCSKLRPSQLTTAYRDSELDVQRASAENTLQDDAHRSLADAFQELWAPFPTATWDVQLKVVRVQLDTDKVQAEVHFHASNGHTRPESQHTHPLTQQNAVWQTTWHWPVPNSPPTLQRVALRPGSFEEVSTRNPRPLFSDSTTTTLRLAESESLQRLLLTSQADWTDRMEAAFGMDIGAFHGLALGDANGDGLEDIYACMPGGLPNCMLVQQPDGTVKDQAAAMGLDLLDFTRHALFVDLDNDGDQDLPMLINGAVLVFENRQGTFHARAPISVDANLYSLSAADIDNDGLLDLHVTGRDAASSKDQRSLLGDPLPYHDATNGGTDGMLRNLGALRFADVTREVGLSDNRFSQAAAWEDYDNDGDLDLYVANDYGRNALYQNNGGRFRNVAAEAGVEDLAAGMSVSWADYNGDGNMDLYVSNMFSSAGNRVAYQRHFQATASDDVRSQFQRHARGNTLFANQGDGTFRDVSETKAVTMGRWAWSSAFCDINNDGWHDLLVTNGFVTNEQSDDL